MARNGDPCGFLPTPEQQQLLRACLLRDEAAVSAWRQWRASADLDHLDAGSNRLLPLLYRNLARLGVPDPEMARLKGIYRYYWSKNHLLFHDAGELAGRLQQRGIPVLLLKGAALVVAHYQDPGVRPMADVDLLVPSAQAQAAADCLRESGWRLKDGVSFEELMRCSYAGVFANARGQEIDLHWFALPEGRQPGADAHFWDASAPANLGNAAVRCASPADLLLHVCAHGAYWCPVPPVRWVADALVILQTAGDRLDWDRFLAQARARWLTLALHTTLDYLRRAFAATIPARVMTALETSPHPWLERYEYRARFHPRGVLGALPEHISNYLRLMKPASRWQTVARAPRHFQRLWALPSVTALPPFLARKAWRRLHFRSKPQA
ncbi:MAG: nucleotidyltransferase family protein [Verrucomicrobiota bacterium]